MNVLAVSVTLLSLSVGQAAPATQASTNNVEAAKASLKRAYLKELAFLKAQKRSLKDRLATLESSSSKRMEVANAELADLEIQVLALQRQGSRLAEELERSEARAERESAAGLADSTLHRASEALGTEFTAETAPKKLEEAVNGGIDRLQSLSSTTRESGSFFLSDGTKVDGEVIKVGAIAAYGVSERGAGVLAPAGDGGLRLWDAPTDSAARSIQKGSVSGTLPIFLFEGLDEPVIQKEEPSLVEQVSAGGFIAWVIVVLGLAALLFAVLRTLMLGNFARLNRRTEQAVLATCEKSGLARTLEVAQEAKGPSASVLQWALAQLGSNAPGEESTDRAIEEALLQESARVERFGTLIVVVAAVAPLLGLLGTVTGMITTFDVITEFGTGDPRMLSGGISEALITTKLGLMVAIPALLAATLLAHWAEGIIVRMEHTTLHVVNVLQASKVSPPDHLVAVPHDVNSPSRPTQRAASL